MESIADTNGKVIRPGKTKKTAAAEVFKFNPFLPEFHANPYPTYHYLRSSDPIHRSFLGAWVLTRYVDVKAVLRDPCFSVDKLSTHLKDKSYYLKQQRDLNTLTQVTSKWLIFLEPPDHTRLRKLVSKAFTSGVVERQRPDIQNIVDELIDKVEDKEVMDIISDLASPLPVTVIAKMLGVPAEDCSQLKQWSNDVSHILDPLLSLETYEHLNQVVVEFKEYFRGLFAERRKRPKEDLISALIAASEQGDKLSEDEMLSTCTLLFFAGEETTVDTIGNGILALLRHPDQMEKLKREPAIIQSAVEELLRYDSPVQHTQRIATENVEIGGKTIRAGDKVVVCLAAANRDPAQFPDPDRLDLTRRENCHLAFLDGIHSCLGAALARLNSQIAINTLVQRLPDIKLQKDTLEWRKNVVLRGLKSLPVTFTR